eukprot:416885-Prorocentrum_minimum.AAC.1
MNTKVAQHCLKSYLNSQPLQGPPALSVKWRGLAATLRLVSPPPDGAVHLDSPAARLRPRCAPQSNKP